MNIRATLNEEPYYANQVRTTAVFHVNCASVTKTGL
jgi:hypothetical protein